MEIKNFTFKEQLSDILKLPFELAIRKGDVVNGHRILEDVHYYVTPKGIRNYRVVLSAKNPEQNNVRKIDFEELPKKVQAKIFKLLPDSSFVDHIDREEMIDELMILHRIETAKEYKLPYGNGNEFVGYHIVGKSGKHYYYVVGPDGKVRAEDYTKDTAVKGLVSTKVYSGWKEIPEEVRHFHLSEKTDDRLDYILRIAVQDSNLVHLYRTTEVVEIGDIVIVHDCNGKPYYYRRTDDGMEPANVKNSAWNLLTISERTAHLKKAGVLK